MDNINNREKNEVEYNPTKQQRKKQPPPPPPPLPSSTSSSWQTPSYMSPPPPPLEVSPDSGATMSSRKTHRSSASSSTMSGSSSSATTKSTTTTTTSTTSTSSSSSSIVTTTSSSSAPMIEIEPGVLEPLRGSQETLLALRMGNIQSVLCIGCQAIVSCILEAKYVICPCCKVISATAVADNQKTLPKHVTPMGVGLGFLRT